MNKDSQGKTIDVGDIVARKEWNGEREVNVEYLCAASNVTTGKISILPAKGIYALELVDAEKMSKVEEAETGRKPRSAGKGSGEGSKKQESQQELRNDGPTLKEFIKAGGKPEEYPPKGYAPRED